jgi:phosphatidylglycerol lysyltransferase
MIPGRGSSGRLERAHPARRGFRRDHSVRLLEEWGTTPHSRIARGPQYEHLLLAGNRCVLPFLPAGRFALCLGGPVGPPGLLGVAVAEGHQRLRHQGLAPVFVPLTRADLGPGGRSSRNPFSHVGLDLVHLGSEARLRLGEFHLRGNRRKMLRQSRNHLRRRGCRFRLLEPPLTNAALAQLRTVSEAWIAGLGLPERRFGTTRFDEDSIARSRVAVIEGGRGEILAFADLLDTYSGVEASVDLMRRRPGSPNGIMETLFVELALALRAEGTRVFNLGFCPLHGVGRGPEAHLFERALPHLVRPFRRVYDLAGLAAFKNRFDPEHLPVFAACPRGVDRTLGLMALLEINPFVELLRRVRPVRGDS